MGTQTVTWKVSEGDLELTRSIAHESRPGPPAQRSRRTQRTGGDPEELESGARARSLPSNRFPRSLVEVLAGAAHPGVCWLRGGGRLSLGARQPLFPARQRRQSPTGFLVDWVSGLLLHYCMTA